METKQSEEFQLIDDIKDKNQTPKKSQLQNIKENIQIINQDLQVHILRDPLYLQSSNGLQKNIENIVKSPVVYCYAIPIGECCNQFIIQVIEKFGSVIQCIRKINQIKKNSHTLELQKLYMISLIIYFTEQIFAEQFIEMYNGYCLDPKTEEILYTSYIKRVWFFQSDCLSILDYLQEQKQEQLMSIPGCPICIERIDSIATGLDFSKVNIDSINFSNQLRWKLVREACNTCTVKENECRECLQQQGIRQTEDLWVCLICSSLGCGRYKCGHSLQHQKQSSHNFSQDLTTGRIWDYINDSFVHRIIQDNNDKQRFVNLPEGNALNGYMENDEKIELIDKGIWEYCYVIQQQMEEQRRYFEEKIQELESKRENSEQMTQLTQSLSYYKNELTKLQQKGIQLQEETEKMIRQQKILQDKAKIIEQDIESSTLFINSVEENVQHLKNQQEKNRELKPLQKEIEHEQQKLDELNALCEQLAKQFEAL